MISGRDCKSRGEMWRKWRIVRKRERKREWEKWKEKDRGRIVKRVEKVRKRKGKKEWEKLREKIEREQKMVIIERKQKSTIIHLHIDWELKYK